jgi:hypothetical protein
MIIKTKHAFSGLLMKTRPERDLQQMAQCIYSIPFECGRCYIGVTGRLLIVWLHEHRQNIQESLVKKKRKRKRKKVGPTCI